jgi:1,4-dihydroxy-2-naphthoate octaprenyltransferase
MPTTRSVNQISGSTPGGLRVPHPWMFKLWIQAARPWTLGVGWSPIIMGTAIAHTQGGIHWLGALGAFLAGTLIQIGTNLANDYFDFKKGGDTANRVGPQRVTQAGLIPPGTVKNAFLFCFGLAFLIGIYLVYLGGWPIVWVGLFSLLLGVIYTGGPFPLAYHGLAELPAFLFFGPIASAGTTYVQTGHWSAASILAGCSAGFFSVALLSINNLRDHQEDLQAGKHTLIARFGRTFGTIEYSFSLALATLTPLALIFIEPGHGLMIIPALTFLMALHPIRLAVQYQQPKELLGVLKLTAKLEAVFTVMFCVSWLF